MILQAGFEVSDALGKNLKGQALLVGGGLGPQNVKTPGCPTWSPEDSLDELEALCDSLDIKVKDRVWQQWRPHLGSRLPVGRGKQDEIRQQVRYDPDIGIVVFDMDLSFRSLMTLKGRIDPDDNAVLMDRTSLILRIFAKRARTQEAKLQVLLANQQYMLPRLQYYLTEGGGLESRGGSGGGQGLKGMGQTQIAQDKFVLRKQIAVTKRRIDDVRKHREMLRENQHELGLPIISLVGYTNAGKSSLLNRLCGSDEVTVKNRLFETLDPTRRRAKLLNGREVLIVDTVGFVQRLPEQLVAGFRATLEELSEATIVLHVVDASSLTAAEQVATVHATMARLDSFDKETPQLLVFNKIDRLEGGVAEELEQSLTFPWPGVVGHCQVSALTGVGLQALADAIEDTLLRHTSFGAEHMQLLIPYVNSSDYAKMRGPPPMVKIETEEHTADGYLVDVVATPDAARQLRRFQVPSGKNATLAA